jgi:hypothetical protein
MTKRNKKSWGKAVLFSCLALITAASGLMGLWPNRTAEAATGDYSVDWVKNGVCADPNESDMSGTWKNVVGQDGDIYLVCKAQKEEDSSTQTTYGALSLMEQYNSDGPDTTTLAFDFV